MFYLQKTLESWGQPNFTESFKLEIGNLSAEELLLQKAQTHGNYTTTNNLGVTILSTNENEFRIEIKAGIFFTSAISGCQCADDPSPVDELNEYCEIYFTIDKSTAFSTARLALS